MIVASPQTPVHRSGGAPNPGCYHDAMIDSHTHLYWKKFDDDRQAVMERARAAGVEAFLVIGIDIPSCEQALNMARDCQEIYATAGFHPTSVGTLTEYDWNRLEELLGEDKVVAVGETGLDFYWDDTTPEQQEEALLRHFDLARRFDLPLVIHTRESMTAFLDLLETQKGLRGVLHCFSGDIQDMERALAQGFDISFAGPVTYKRNDTLRAVCRAVPADRLHIETDCPFLPPQPHRGKRNEPAWVRLVAECVAREKSLPLDDLMALSASNTRRLFRLPEA